MWDFCAWVGIGTLTVVGLRVAYFAVESWIVVRVGWDRLEELGFWRAIPASMRRLDASHPRRRGK